MKTIVIPVDAADNCNFALNYAADLTHDKPVERIILLQSFYVSVYAQLLPSADFVQLSAQDVNEDREKTKNRIQHIAQQLRQKAATGVKIDVLFSEYPLLRALYHVIEKERPTLLIISSRCKQPTADEYNGDFVIQVAKTSTIPVLIVPSNSSYQPIKTALVPCDFSTVTSISRLKALPPVQPIFHPELMILNVDTGKPAAISLQQIEDELQHILQHYNYEVYYAQNRNILQGIMSFTGMHPYQLIVALPGRHSFFYNLTHSRITQALMLNATQPVLILK